MWHCLYSFLPCGIIFPKGGENVGFLYFLEKIRVPGLNELMLLITRLGEETAFLVAALIVFWCVDKRRGYYVMIVGFIGTMANQFLKLLCRIPRPWVLDPDFTILEQAREAATGYSFPSGHSQNAVGTFGAIGATSKKSLTKWICGAVCILVPLSRMYLGVHTPADVLVGAGMALALVFLLRRPVLETTERSIKVLIPVMLLMAAGLLAYTELWHFPEDMDPHNLESGIKNAYTMLGCLAGVAVVYPLEKKYVNFRTEAKWWVQLLKIVLGLGMVLLVKEGLRTPLEWIFAGHLMARAVRYFLIVLVAGLAWPAVFCRFSGQGGKQCE